MIESEASARWMGKVLIGNPGGDPLEIGMLKYFAHRMRSVLIHLSLSRACQVSMYIRGSLRTASFGDTALTLD